MRICSKAIGVSAFLWCLLFVLAGLCFGGDLIAPTRTLEEPGQSWGSLAVFSEPPELEVLLNGENVGRTPLWLEKLKAGPYLLEVGGKKTEITVVEDKSFKIGLFKGSFLALPEDKKETKPPPAEAKGPVQAQKTESELQERKARDLTMWEVLIGGTSIQLWDSKR